MACEPLAHAALTVKFMPRKWKMVICGGAQEANHMSMASFDALSAFSISFDVVPNPNNGQMSLHFESLTGLVDIKVYDMRGTLIDSFQTYDGTGTYAYTMKNRTDGIYYFVATCKEGTATKKVVIHP